MKLGFTGTQRGLTDKQRDALAGWVEAFKSQLDEFHHGDCVGADAEAHDIVRLASGSVRIVLHPPTVDAKRAFRAANIYREAKPYLTRNKDIVRETDGIIACPADMTEQLRSGTWSTIRFAMRSGKPVRVFYPDGSTILHRT